MIFFRNKKDSGSLAVLLILIAILIFIYVKPQLITSQLTNNQKTIEHLIYNNNYDLDFSNEEKEWLKNTKKISIGIDRAFPPFGSITNENEYIGFSADFMRIIEHRLGIKFEINKDATWSETIELAKLSKLDVVASLVKTKSREQYLDFTSSFINNPTVIISDALKNGYIGSLDSLKNQKIAIEKDSYAHEELSRKFPYINIIPVKNTTEALKLVSSGAADAYIGNAISATYLINELGYQNLSFSGETNFLSNHSIGIKKGNKTLLSIFQKTLDSISISNRAAIKNHWFGIKAQKQITSDTIVKISATFFSLLLILLAWSFSLRRARNKLKQSQELIKQEAEHDHLTGLGNRRKFYQHLKQEIKKAEKSGDSFSLFLIDLDNFKEINNNFGHSVGDLLIIETAKRIRNNISDRDTLYRLGGDEFILIVMDSANKNNTDNYGKKIKASLNTVFYLDENDIHTSASVGITTYPYDATSSKQLLNNVDQAKNHSKKTGKNTFTYFNSAMKSEIILRKNTLTDLRAAIKEDQFELHYQAIVDISSNQITKAEALIRWNHPNRGLIYPDKFIPLAEETGLIVDIGEWVFKKAVSETAKFKKNLGHDFQMSINTSPLQYGKGGMNVSKWFNHVIDSGLSGKDLALEITEGLLMESNDTIRNKLFNLRDLGMQISIDDFGTGYSSLSYLKKFDVDYLKIDRSFVNNLTDESDELILIQTIIAMAHKLGFRVIAEGIETEEQLNILSKEGCDFGQGYHLSKPLVSSEFVKLLNHWEKDKKNVKENSQVISFNKVKNDAS